MAGRRVFEFRVLRFVPNAVQGVGANVGVILTEVGASEGGFADVKLTEDWRLARMLGAEVDLEYLGEMEKAIRARLNSGEMDCSRGGEAVSQREWMLHVLGDWCSNGIEVSEPRAVMAEDPVEELSRLVKMYCELARTSGAERMTSGRRAIVIEMKRTFEQYGVLPLLQKEIRIARYTRAGDPLKIDYGYRHPEKALRDVSRDDQVFRMFQAVSLKGEVEGAKLLALAYQEFRPRMEDEQQARVELTAVVEGGLDREDDAVKFAVGMFEEKNVVVAEVSEMTRIAERARKELAA